jgi:predicted transcriptional regulator
MKKDQPPTLSRRERQIMDIIYRERSATAARVMESLPDPPSYSAVRTHLRLLEEKGHLEHRRDGARYVYYPVVNREKAQKSALRHLVRTFFDGSIEQAVSTLINISKNDLTDQELQRLAAIIEEKKEEGK